MVWYQYTYLVHPDGVLTLRKAQQILAMDVRPKLLDRFLDSLVLEERIVRAPRDPGQRTNSVGFAQPDNLGEYRQKIHARRRNSGQSSGSADITSWGKAGKSLGFAIRLVAYTE